MKVEVFYFDGCVNHRLAVERVQEVLREEGLEAEVAETKVSDRAAAQAVGFLGSPTVRVDGLDVEALRGPHRHTEWRVGPVWTVASGEEFLLEALSAMRYARPFPNARGTKPFEIAEGNHEAFRKGRTGGRRD